MKKFIALLLTGIFVFGAAGCSGSSEDVYKRQPRK